ncbi:hypothetical protein D3C87_1919600 [compost metagenome]
MAGFVPVAPAPKDYAGYGLRLPLQPSVAYDQQLQEILRENTAGGFGLCAEVDVVFLQYNDSKNKYTFLAGQCAAI